MIIGKATLFAFLIATTAWAQSSTTQEPAQKGAPGAKRTEAGKATPAAKSTPEAKATPDAKGAPEAKGTGAPKSTAEAADALNAGKTPAAATVEAIMEQAALNIAARYNLNDAQTDLTRKLMKREVYRFLEEHEAEVWPVIRDLLTAQLGAKPPENRDEVMRIGKAARPLLQLAKKAIFDANDEWHHILSPEQKQVHDFDLSEMKLTFEQIDKNFAEWEAGRPPPDNIFPPPQIDERQPRRPIKPGEEGPIKVVFEPNRIIETLVEAFIKDYELDEGQITAARSILQEFKAKATDFTESKRQEFAEIAKQQQEAITKRDLDGIKKAASAHKKLLEPVYEFCAQMDGRLKGLLTTAQIERHAQKSAAPKKGEQKSAAMAQESSAKKETAAPPPPPPPPASEAPRKDAPPGEAPKKDVPPSEIPPTESGSQSSSDKPQGNGDKSEGASDTQ
jgi:hypothetical protein